MADRKPAKRDDLGLSTCQDIIRAHGPQRASADAAKMARKALKRFLRELATESAQVLKIQKKKTVTLEVLQLALAGKMSCRGVTAAHLQKSSSSSKRGLPLAGVVRVFLGAHEMRMTEEAKKSLVNAATAHLIAIATLSGKMAAAGKRKTVLDGDVEAAISMLA